eukprot:CAMPEP_0115018744 /NCGR_PEP_ID=MMETSP0216-20121206/29019_1 /TAXON_ID=223996 /ORGANISM="Protocruzia adherens, Strain Boccale" /LENGTH=356 /DNA_ID=CAMNT_0002390059 /DNA_START=23 /DNA_END=1089 /DNA_ORIENTATION=-
MARAPPVKEAKTLKKFSDRKKIRKLIVRGREPRKLKLNLNLPPEERWNSIIETIYDEAFESHYSEVFTSLGHLRILSVVQAICLVLCKVTGEFGAEIQGIARKIQEINPQTKVNAGSLFMLNLLYESQAFCTSIVSTNKRGEIHHARNLDFEFTNILRDVTYDIEVYRGRKLLYQATCFAGCTGILTASKPGAFSLSINQREPGTGAWRNVLSGIRGRSTVTWAARKAMEECNNFQEARERLLEVSLIAPCYYILGGVGENEGTVITRNRTDVAETEDLDSENGIWQVMKTNYDSWEEPPDEDDRQTPCRKMLKKHQKTCNRDKLMKILQTNPILNDQTVYSTAMCAGKGGFRTKV